MHRNIIILTVGNVGEGSGGAKEDRGVAPAKPPSCWGDVRGGSVNTLKLTKATVNSLLRPMKILDITDIRRYAPRNCLPADVRHKKNVSKPKHSEQSREKRTDEHFGHRIHSFYPKKYKGSSGLQKVEIFFVNELILRYFSFNP